MADEIKCKMVILTGLPIERADMGRFVVDLETLKLHKDRFSVDYQHDDYIPLGVVSNLHYEEGIGLIGEATLSATNDNDKANEIIQRIAEQYPFEVSPTLDMDASDVYELAEGETKIVNGNEITGECSIYYNVQFRGVGVVLFGTDKNTSITKLTNNTLTTLSYYGDNSMSKKLKKNEVVEETTPTTAELEAEPTTETTPEVPEYITLLNSFLDAFGTEKGLEYFRSNMTMEEAEKADYAELKALRAKLAEKDDEEGGDEGEGGGGDEGGGEGEGGGGEGDSADDDEKEKLMAELKSLKAEVTKLRTVFGNRGEDNPVSTSTKLSAPTLDPIHAMAEKIKRDGIKKKA